LTTSEAGYGTGSSAALTSGSVVKWGTQYLCLFTGGTAVNSPSALNLDAVISPTPWFNSSRKWSPAQNLFKPSVGIDTPCVVQTLDADGNTMAYQNNLTITYTNDVNAYHAFWVVGGTATIPTGFTSTTYTALNSTVYYPIPRGASGSWDEGLHTLQPVHKTNITEVNMGGYKFWAYYCDVLGYGVGLARSNDLISWDKYSGNPLPGLYDGSHTYYRWPSVTFDGTLFQMILGDYPNTDGHLNFIKRYNSADGINFSYVETIYENPGSNIEVQNPFLWFNPNDNKYYLYFAEKNYTRTPQTMTRCKSATTLDGLKTAPVTDVKINNNDEYSPSVLYDPSTGLYWLTTEEGQNWMERAYHSTNPDSGFVQASNSPILTDLDACGMQFWYDNKVYLYYCHMLASWPGPWDTRLQIEAEPGSLEISGCIPFSDSFGNGNGWQRNGPGNWRVNNGAIENNGNTINDVYLYSNLVTGDIRVGATLSAPAGKYYNAYLIARASGTGSNTNCYGVNFRAYNPGGGYGPDVRILKDVNSLGWNGGGEHFITGPVPAVLPNGANVEFRVYGTTTVTLEGYVNGVKVTSITDSGQLYGSPFTSGLFGLQAWEQNAANGVSDYSNVYVTKFVSPEPSHGLWGSEEGYLHCHSIYVDPVLVEKNISDIGERFNANITIEGVRDLFGFDLNITWDNGLITLVGVEFTTRLDEVWGRDQWFCAYNNTGLGWYALSAVSLSAGFTTTGARPLITFQFLVENAPAGETPIHFEMAKLGSSEWKTIPIDEVIDGTYRMLPWPALLKMTPALVEKTHSDIGAYFNVTVTVGNVEALFGFDFNVTWDNHLLTFNNCYYTSMLNSIWGVGNWLVIKNENATSWLKFVAMSTKESFSATGDQSLFIIEFRIEDPPTGSLNETSIHFATHKLSDSSSNPIAHIAMDGTYRITGEKPTIQMIPTGKTCRKYGETYSINVDVSGAENVEGFRFEIHYNTTLLDFASVAWNAWGSGTLIVDEVNGNLTGFTAGPQLNGTITLLTIQFNATYYHIWKSITGWINDQSGLIFFQWTNLSFPSGPDLRYERGGLNQISVGPDFVCIFSPIIGDVNNDGMVDVLDLRAAATYYSIKDGDPEWVHASAYDLNGDGIVDVFDLRIVASNFGYIYAP
jgi:hypothetical protein